MRYSLIWLGFMITVVTIGFQMAMKKATANPLQQEQTKEQPDELDTNHSANHSSVWTQQCITLVQMGDYEAAIAVCQTALDLNDNADTWNNQAVGLGD